ncbi:MAG: hypothetical protein ACK5N0_04095 [Synechococcaceae cyanobacterium]
MREESEQGTFFRRILVVEGANGDRFNVYVGETAYREAKPGMWIKGDKFGVRITEPDQLEMMGRSGGTTQDAR